MYLFKYTVLEFKIQKKLLTDNARTLDSKL